MPRGLGGLGEGSTPGSGGDPKVIPRRFKRKKIFVTDEAVAAAVVAGWTDRRDSRNSVVDVLIKPFLSKMFINNIHSIQFWLCFEKY